MRQLAEEWHTSKYVREILVDFDTTVAWMEGSKSPPVPKLLRVSSIRVMYFGRIGNGERIMIR